MLNLLFPKLCNGCRKQLYRNEEILCTNCLHSIPLAQHHLHADSSMKDLFYGRIPVLQATALLRFTKKGISQELLHNLKYRKQQKISYYLGSWLGAELAQQADYRTVEGIVAVPLHKRKQRQRGYNQVDGFAKALAENLKVPYHSKALVKMGKTSTQVFKQRGKRFDSEGVFMLRNAETVAGKHILLVDDIVTTGATLEKCALELLKAPQVSISLATMAIA